MAGMGPAPKPDAERARRNGPTFGWVDLPAEGRKGKPPALPKWRMWDARTEAWWAELWATPQATQWQPSGSTLHVLACLVDDLVTARAESARVSAEMRQHEDRHGLSPKAMLQLRWRIVAAGEPPPAPAPPAKRGRKKAAATVTPIDDRRARVARGLGVKVKA